MFRRATALLSSVADVLDDMLSADFEFELEEAEGVQPLEDTCADPAFSAATCAGELRLHRTADMPRAPRRSGAVPRPIEFCLTPVESGRDRHNGSGPRG